MSRPSPAGENVARDPRARVGQPHQLGNLARCVWTGESQGLDAPAGQSHALRKSKSLNARWDVHARDTVRAIR